jgi:hypothetical protein
VALAAFGASGRSQGRATSGCGRDRFIPSISG